MRSGWMLVAVLAMLGAYGGGGYLLYEHSQLRLAPPHKSPSSAQAIPQVREVAPGAQLVLASHGSAPIRPVVSAVRVDREGRVTISGSAAPRVTIFVLIAGRVLPPVSADGDGGWLTTAADVLPVGSYTLGLVTQSASDSAPVAGDLIRIDIPSRGIKSSRVVYRGPVSRADPTPRTRVLGPRLAQAPPSAEMHRSDAAPGNLTVVLQNWLRQSGETYKDAARRLSVVPSEQPERAPRRVVQRPVLPPSRPVEPVSGGVLETAWSWYHRVSREYDFVIRKLSSGEVDIAARRPDERERRTEKPEISSASAEAAAQREKEAKRLAAARRELAEREREQQDAGRRALLAERRRLEAEARRAAEQRRRAALAAKNAEDLRRAAERRREEERLRLAYARDARRRAEEQVRMEAAVRKAAEAGRLAEARHAEAERQAREARAEKARRQVAAKPRQADPRQAAALRQAKIALGIAQEAGKLVSAGKTDEGLFLAAEAARQAIEARQLASAGPFPVAFDVAQEASRTAAEARLRAMAQRKKAARQVALSAPKAVVPPAESAIAKPKAPRLQLVALREEAQRRLRALRLGPPPLPGGQVAPSPGDTTAPEIKAEDFSDLRSLSEAALKLVQRAQEFLDANNYRAAGWVASEAAVKAGVVHQGAVARSADAIAAQAASTRNQAKQIADQAASRRSQSERKIASARRGPPALSGASARRIAAALATGRTAASKKATTTRKRPARRVAALAPDKRKRWRKAKAAAKKKKARSRSKVQRATKRSKKVTKRRKRKVARASVKRWVRRSVKKRSKRRDKYRRARRRQRHQRMRWYVVKRGDSLWKIARRFFGRGERYRAIVRVNRRRVDLSNPNLIYPKQRLRIPRLRG